MLDYFLSSDWAIIATELLAGFFVITLVLAVLVWRGQRRHTSAAESLLDDRDPILRATEEMVERQIKRLWPDMTLDEEQRQIYAERSLDAVEAMVEPWLEPKRSDLSSVARQFQRVRQEDLEQLLTLARAHAEASQADDERVAELEQELQESREQRDRQAKHLNESLETVNVMVREYGRKFDYNEEPRVATVLKAIVMVEEMAAGADCETAQQRAENVFSEDLVASAAPVEEPTPADNEPAAAESGDTDTEESDEEAPAPIDAAEQMAAAMEMEAAASGEADSIDVGGEQTGRDEAAETLSTDTSETETDDASEAPTPSTEAKPTPDEGAEEDDIDALIAQSQGETDSEPTSDETASEKAEPVTESGDDSPATEEPATEEPAEQEQEEARAAEQPPAEAADEEAASTDQEPAATEPEQPSESEPNKSEARRKEDTDDNEDNGVIDLDDVEIPEEDQEKAESDANEFDLDDIDALLDAEIAKKHGKS